MKAFVPGLAALLMLAGPAAAEAIPPFDAPLGDGEFTLGGRIDAAGIAPHGAAPGSFGSGAVRLEPGLERDYDSGLVLALKTTFLAYHDRLSAERYGGNLIEKFAGEIRTGLGRFTIGETDGAAYALAVGIPRVDEEISLDDPEIVLFRYPVTRRVLHPLPLASAIAASSDFAKFVYTSPTLFGVTLALSFTPDQGKYILPFLHEGPEVANRQADIWEAGLRYSDDFRPVTLSAYGGIAEGRGERKTAGYEGLSDLAAGLRADYQANDALTISIGGGYRRTNEYDFDITRAFASGATSAGTIGASVSDDGWVAGIEYGNGTADAIQGAPSLSVNSYQLSLGYDLTGNLRLSGGWQRQNYARGTGAFTNGASRLKLDAGFLHLDFHV